MAHTEGFLAPRSGARPLSPRAMQCCICLHSDAHRPKVATQRMRML